MNGSAVLLVVALIAISGFPANGQPVDQNQVPEGPTTFQIAKNSHGKITVLPINSFSIGNITAAEFAIGNLTRNSILSVLLHIQSTSEGYFIYNNIEASNYTYTFIQTFDTSADGISGGYVELIDGGNGTKQFTLAVTPAANQNISLYIVAYAEDLINAGRNYRFGDYRPALTLLSLSEISAPAVNDTITSLRYRNFVNGEIVYMQSVDLVPRGSGALYLAGGGVGGYVAHFWGVSGYGEAIDRVIEIYGTPFH